MKPQHPSIKELFAIVAIEDWTSFDPAKTRREALEKWARSWVIDVEFSQSVVSADYLTSEYMDLIKVKLSQELAEDLSEDCTIYSTEDRKVSAQMCAFRRQAKQRASNE